MMAFVYMDRDRHYFISTTYRVLREDQQSGFTGDKKTRHQMQSQPGYTWKFLNPWLAKSTFHRVERLINTTEYVRMIWVLKRNLGDWTGTSVAIKVSLAL